MGKPIWGIQAEVANKTEPLDEFGLLEELVDLAINASSRSCDWNKIAAETMLAALRLRQWG